MKTPISSSVSGHPMFPFGPFESPSSLPSPSRTTNQGMPPTLPFGKEAWSSLPPATFDVSM